MYNEYNLFIYYILVKTENSHKKMGWPTFGIVIFNIQTICCSLTSSAVVQVNYIINSSHTSLQLEYKMFEFNANYQNGVY